MSDRLEGKVALISGAARGQGESHARLMASEGATVVLGDILEAEVMAVAKDIEAAGNVAESVFLDVTRSEDWAVAVDWTEDRFGHVDVLVNNAGIITEGGAVDEPEDVWDRVIAVNQTGMFLGMKHAVPAMRRAGGRLDHQHRLDARRRRGRGLHRLSGEQGCHTADDQVRGALVRERRDPRELDLPRVHPNADDRCLGGSDPAARHRDDADGPSRRADRDLVGGGVPRLG
jgi:NAD(P)-dependent dehydrogenase (short-subunit alcohol dehydrogenase family)